MNERRGDKKKKERKTTKNIYIIQPVCLSSMRRSFSHDMYKSYEEVYGARYPDAFLIVNVISILFSKTRRPTTDILVTQKHFYPFFFLYPEAVATSR